MDPLSCYYDKRIEYFYRLFKTNKLTYDEIGLPSFFNYEKLKETIAWRLAV